MCLADWNKTVKPGCGGKLDYGLASSTWMLHTSDLLVPIIHFSEIFMEASWVWSMKFLNIFLITIDFIVLPCWIIFNFVEKNILQHNFIMYSSILGILQLQKIRNCWNKWVTKASNHNYKCLHSYQELHDSFQKKK